jgi:hypothetical protein
MGDDVAKVTVIYLFETGYNPDVTNPPSRGCFGHQEEKK